MNPERREAIMHVDDPLIVFTGPAGGKARVIVIRDQISTHEDLIGRLTRLSLRYQKLLLAMIGDL